jgi:putative transcriptional regulator
MLPSSGLPLIVGLIINRPTAIPLRQLFPQNPALKGKAETAYFGGPVDVGDPSVVFRTSQAPKGAIRLVDGVYLSFDPHVVETLLANPQGTQDVRIFLGRSQWAPEQLQNEMLQGAWYSVEAESKLIFAADPQQVWHTLLNRAQPANVVDYRIPAPATPARPEKECFSKPCEASSARRESGSTFRLIPIQKFSRTSVTSVLAISRDRRSSAG